MTTRNDNAAKSINDTAAATMTDVPAGALDRTATVADAVHGKRRRVGTLMWKYGEARGWRSTFMSI